MEKSELVIELGLEEIPASMIEDATHQFANLLLEELQAQRLSVDSRTQWYTPRRIIVGFDGIAVCQEDLVEEIIGPPKRVAFDAAGEPTKATLAFAQKNGVQPSQLKIIQTPKGEYVSLQRAVRGEKTHKILEALIPAAISKIQFPKTMHWSEDHFRFARPLRWVVALFGGKVVRFQIADVKSSKFTAGHRFLGKHKMAVSSLALLKEKLRENSVLVDPEERLAQIRDGLQREALNSGGRLLDDPELLNTVVNLNEIPSVVCGSFEKRFLALPQEILVTVMREHQKYFSVLDNDGQLLPVFLAVVNLQSDSRGIIRSGHERVLRARLADAAFFWETDRKTRLGDREEALKSVLFQEKLGSYNDKTRRVLALLPRVAEVAGRPELISDLMTAGHLYKCDLITEMVKEFTDLQGIVGGLYARAEGYPASVWQAIYEQYYPKSANSASPSSNTGALLALVDRLDTVCGCFSVGLIPSGSGDPFAVRRQGNGIIKIIFDHRLSLSLDEMFRWSLKAYDRESDQVINALKEFFEGRLRFLFEETGFAYDCINAVLAAGFDDPLDVLERLKSLQELRQEADFLSLASNFKRIMNLLAQAGIASESLEESLLKEPAEVALWQSYIKVQPEVSAAQKNHDYGTALRALASMRLVVDEFFKEIMVMAEDLRIRANRIALLNRISQLFCKIADISKIVIERSA
ncbi:MAG: glycine--tRNA ligase subunit beta [Acidobacteria bacterium]|nr:glycine--tRNA ligase subunit beta [Acidobacteriota bacterium]